MQQYVLCQGSCSKKYAILRLNVSAVSFSVCTEAPTVTTSTFLFPESELVTEPEEEEEKKEEDTKEAEEEEEEERSADCPSLADSKVSVL